MKHIANIAVSLISAFILFCFFTSCGKNADKTLDIPIQIEFTDVFPGATEFTVTSIKKGILDRPASLPFIITEPVDEAPYKAGDPCIIISAEFKNNTDNDTIVLLTAAGYDANGIQKSGVLDSGPLAGVGNYDALAKSTNPTDITLNWADDLVIIRIKATVRHNLYETVEPATPVPESEMARIWFDEEWFYANDKDPDPYNVRITFPKKWMETGKSDTYNGTGGIELAVPTQLLLDDNESTNPDEITVYFPNYYFNGLPDAPLPYPNH